MWGVCIFVIELYSWRTRGKDSCMNTGASSGPPSRDRISKMAPSAARQSFLQLFSDMLVSKLSSEAVGWLLSQPSACQTELHVQHDSTASREPRPCPVFRPVYIDFGREASWPLTYADDDFVLPRCLVDVSDANVCHRVPLCRWHACLEPRICYISLFLRFKVICHRTFTWILCIDTEIDIFKEFRLIKCYLWRCAIYCF